MSFLIAFEIAILIFSLLIFKGDFFNPSTISVTVFMAATILCAFYAELWQVKIVWKTVLVVVTSLLMMIVGTALGRSASVTGNEKLNSAGRHIRLTMSTGTIVFISTLVVIMTVLYGFSAYKLGQSHGGTGLNSFAYLKDAYSHGTATVRMNVFIRQGYKIVLACAYVGCLLLAVQLVQGIYQTRRSLVYLGWIICGALITIMSGSRTDIVRIFSAFIIDYVIISRIWNKREENTRRRKVKSVWHYLIPALLLVIVVSFSVRQIIKTSNVELSQSNSLFYYLSYYVGSPIAVLNEKISMGFSGVTLAVGAPISVPNFVYLGNLNYGGNVDTLLGLTLQKYGIIMLWVKLLIVYGIGSFFYFKAESEYLRSKRSYYWILITSLVYQIFTMSYYSDSLYVFSDIVTNGLIFIGTIVIFYLFVQSSDGNE